MEKQYSVNTITCGKFHYFNYLEHLYSYKTLNKFYYSHKLSSKNILKSIPKEKLINVWIKEYLVQAQIKYYNFLGNNEFPLYNSLFDYLASILLDKTDLTHIMLHGTTLKTIKKAKKYKSIIIGEPVNSHPVQMHTILNEAAEHWGLPLIEELSLQQKNMLTEIKYIDFLLCASNFIAKTYINQGFDKSKIKVIPYAINTSRFSITNTKKSMTNKFKAIFVGQLSLRKGILDLIKAWNELKLHNAELVIIGRIDKKIEPLLKFDKNINYLGPIPNNKLNDYYNSSNLFIMPSLEDGFGQVCLEAMAAGLPVIVTENTGSKDVVKENYNGVIIPVNDNDKLKEKIEYFYSHRDICKEMGLNANKTAKSKYTWESYADKLDKYYRSII